MKKLQEKILLEEPVDTIEMDVEKLPNVELSEPITIEEPVVSEEDKINGFVNMLSSEISETYNNIAGLKSILVTINSDLPDRDDVKDIINGIIDERTMHVGMLQKAIDSLDTQHKELVSAGEEKAETIAGEPANDLNQEDK